MACWQRGSPVPYLHIARGLAALDSTTKRLRIGDALANIFRAIMALSPGKRPARLVTFLGMLRLGHVCMRSRHAHRGSPAHWAACFMSSMCISIPWHSGRDMPRRAGQHLPSRLLRMSYAPSRRPARLTTDCPGHPADQGCVNPEPLEPQTPRRSDMTAEVCGAILLLAPDPIQAILSAPRARHDTREALLLCMACS